MKAASEAEFLLFLRHLYFSARLHMPPFIPKKELLNDEYQLLDVGIPTCIQPRFVSAPITGNLSSYTETEEWSEGLLSLFHYFDCQSALDRCEAVISHHVQVGGLQQLVRRAWQWHPVSVRYGLKKAEGVCLAMMARDTNIQMSVPFYAERLEKLSRAELIRLIEALSARDNGVGGRA